MNFGHVLTAMVTPFDTNGEMDLAQTTILIEHLLANGTEGLVVAGTTGESPTLSKIEKIKLFKHVVEVVNGRVPVIAGTGSYNTQDSAVLTKEAASCGVDGIMLVTPYYNNTNQAGLYEHFSYIAKETTLPIMLYNIPGRSVVNLKAETTIRLSHIENIVAIKEASGDLDQMTEIITKTRDDFVLYSGDDSMTLPVLSIGGVGVVSVSSHVIGKEMNAMIHAYLEGNVKEAAKIHRKYLPVMKGLFSAPSPAPVKAALQMKNIEVGSVRLPLVSLSKKKTTVLSKLINKI